MQMKVANRAAQRSSMQIHTLFNRGVQHNDTPVSCSETTYRLYETFTNLPRSAQYVVEMEQVDNDDINVQDETPTYVQFLN
jgi:hypothetical protein